MSAGCFAFGVVGVEGDPHLSSPLQGDEPCWADLAADFERRGVGSRDRAERTCCSIEGSDASWFLPLKEGGQVGVGMNGPRTGSSRKRFSRTPEQTEIARRLRREASKTERKIWPHLQAARMGASFRRQYSVDKYFADYCCRSLRLVIEVDGPTHRAARDAVRDARIGRCGFDVVRFSVQEIDENLQGVIDTIYGEVQLRLARRRAGLKARIGGG